MKGERNHFETMAEGEGCDEIAQEENNGVDGRDAIDADFDLLPEETRRVLIEGLYKVGNEWTVIPARKFLMADPSTRVRALRALSGMTQSELARSARVRQADVSIAERNVDNVRVGVMKSIARALGTSLQSLFFVSEKKEVLE